MRPSRVINGVTFPPVGRCIYCGTAEGKLTDEHIIPYGLAGDGLVLPASSCRSCAKITSGYEHHCLRSFFGPLRLRLNYPSRNKDPKPDKLGIRLFFADNSERVEQVSLDQCPTLLAMPKFELARILSDPDTQVRPVRFNMGYWVVDQERADKLLRQHGAQGWGPAHRANLQPFVLMRMLAKIGYAYAVAQRGLNSFTPYLLDVIAGRSDDLGNWVGGGLDDPAEAASNQQHEVQIGPAYRNGKKHLAATVRLFACYGAPRYHAIVGEER